MNYLYPSYALEETKVRMIDNKHFESVVTANSKLYIFLWILQNIKQKLGKTCAYQEWVPKSELNVFKYQDKYVSSNAAIFY